MINNSKQSCWNDDQLRAAVAANRSWRGVLRTFGYSPTSGAAKVRIQRDVQRLGISTEHFTGQRKWTDAQLIREVGNANSWSELLRGMKMYSDNSAARAMLKSHSMRPGLSLERPELMPPPEAHALPAQLSQLRYGATSLASSWFQLRGCQVFIPLEPGPYDLVAELPSGLRKVQGVGMPRDLEITPQSPRRLELGLLPLNRK